MGAQVVGPPLPPIGAKVVVAGVSAGVGARVGLGVVGAGVVPAFSFYYSLFKSDLTPSQESNID
jgi:hypothetical protein